MEPEPAQLQLFEGTAQAAFSGLEMYGILFSHFFKSGQDWSKT